MSCYLKFVTIQTYLLLKQFILINLISDSILLIVSFNQQFVGMAHLKMLYLTSFSCKMRVLRRYFYIYNKRLIKQYYKNKQMEPEVSIASLPTRIRGSRTSSWRNSHISTNYFQVVLKQKIQLIYIYVVKFTPQIPYDNTLKRQNLLSKVDKELKNKVGNYSHTGCNIYTTKHFQSQQFQLTVDEYVLVFKKIKQAKVQEHQKLFLQFLNTCISKILYKNNFMGFGRTGKYFNVNSSIALNSMSAYSGYKANFLKMEKKMYWRVDTAIKIVRKQTVLDFINCFYRVHSTLERDQKRNLLKEKLIGKTVMTNYGTFRYIAIEDIIFTTIDQFKFRPKNMDNSLQVQSVTLRQYFDKKYGIKIQNSKQPLLQIKTKFIKEGQQKPLVVPQLCYMTGLPEDINQIQRKQISEKTKKNIKQKNQDIKKFRKNLQKDEEFKSLKEIGINISNNLESISSKIIPVPKIALGQNRNVPNGRQSNFQLFRDPIYNASKNIRCAVINCSRGDVNSIIQTFRSTAENLKVSLDIKKYSVQSDQRNSKKILSQLQTIVKNLKEKTNANICLIALPSYMANQYSEIKKITLLKYDILSQCVLQKTLMKKGIQSIATKILLQMIAKCKNILWVPKLEADINKRILLIAIDFAKMNQKNIVLCCGTLTNDFSKKFTIPQIYTQTTQKEVAMRNCTLKIINQYSKTNKQFPDQILILQNKTSYSQTKIAIQSFMEPLKQQLSKISQNRNIGVAYILSNTRTSTKFFMGNNQNVENVKAGTLVFSDVVSQNFDFYLVSQNTFRGTAMPIHYEIVYSTSSIQQGLIYQIIYSQCYNYANWTGSIKIPGIMQYAKKGAKFSSQALSGIDVSDSLKQCPYYI